MGKRTRRNHTPAFKAKVAVAALKGEKTLGELRSSSTFTSTRSRNGRPIYSKEPQAFSTTVGAKLRFSRSI